MASHDHSWRLWGVLENRRCVAQGDFQGALDETLVQQERVRVFLIVTSYLEREPAVVCPQGGRYDALQ